MRTLAVASAVCIAALFPAAAQAGTATVVHNGQVMATYTGADGEENDLTVRVEGTHADEDIAVVFEDAGAPVDAGEECTQMGPNAARCPHPMLERVVVNAGDEDDDVLLASDNSFLIHEVHAGTGDDEVTGSDEDELSYGNELYGDAGVDVLTGGNGRDQLDGGADSDVLDGAEGDDRLTGDARGETSALAPDRIDGGAGSDYVDYSDRTSPVDVDLARGGGNGQSGENDELTAMENVYAGPGGGTLAGDAGPNSLVGGGFTITVLVGRAGNDTLRGGEGDEDMSGGRGDDTLYGGGGRDTLRGGRGDDVLQPELVITNTTNHALAWARAINCGRGFDLVHETREHDLVPADCERVQLGGVGVSPRLRRVGDEIDMRLTRIYPRDEVGFCRAAVAVLAPNPQASETPRRRRIASGAARVFRGREVRVRLELNAYGRQLVARNPNPLVLIRANQEDSCKGPPAPIGRGGFTARLRKAD